MEPYERGTEMNTLSSVNTQFNCSGVEFEPQTFQLTKCSAILPSMYAIICLLHGYRDSTTGLNLNGNLRDSFALLKTFRKPFREIALEETGNGVVVLNF